MKRSMNLSSLPRSRVPGSSTRLLLPLNQRDLGTNSFFNIHYVCMFLHAEAEKESVREFSIVQLAV